MNTTIDIAKKPAVPPGKEVMKVATSRENPDWIRPQPIAVAAPMMSKIAPDRIAVSSTMGLSRDQSNSL